MCPVTAAPGSRGCSSDPLLFPLQQLALPQLLQGQQCAGSRVLRRLSLNSLVRTCPIGDMRSDGACRSIHCVCVCSFQGQATRWSSDGAASLCGERRSGQLGRSPPCICTLSFPISLPLGPDAHRLEDRTCHSNASSVSGSVSQGN